MTALEPWTSGLDLLCPLYCYGSFYTDWLEQTSDSQTCFLQSGTPEGPPSPLLLLLVLLTLGAGDGKDFPVLPKLLERKQVSDSDLGKECGRCVRGECRSAAGFSFV